MNPLTPPFRGTTTGTSGTATQPRATRRPRSWFAAAAVTAAAALTFGVVLPAAATVASGRPAAAASAATAPAVPKYYVALDNPENAKSPDKVVVGDTLTGKRLATVSPPKGVTFGGVTGAADDRTFILDGRQFPWSNTWFAVTPRTWYLLKIAPGTAHPAKLTKLRIPATPNWAQVDGMALSPDGSELAVMFTPQAWGPTPGPTTLRIYSVVTGKVLHTWVGPKPSPSALGDYTFGQYLYLDDNATLSWTAGGRLAFVYGQSLINDTTVRALNPTGPGHGLLADSRVILDLKSGGVPDCGSLLLAPGGQTIACGATLPFSRNSTGGCSAATGLAKPGIDEYSAATGKLNRVLYRYTGACLDGRAAVLWVSGSGGATVLGDLGIATQLRTGTHQIGIFTGGTFKPLPIRTASGAPSAATIAF